MSVEEQIEEILQEASAYGLRYEVNMWAKQYIEDGYLSLQAYQKAFKDCIKQTKR
jgi:hypothetical protein